MRKRKKLLKICLRVYLGISIACLLAYWIPVVSEISVFHMWLICTNIFRLGLVTNVCALLF